jgi:GTP cyclohydrolase III
MFIYFDGDDIGNHLELLLLDGQLDEAANFSRQVSTAMCEIQKFLQQLSGVKIHLCGGDDLIANFSEISLSAEEVELLRKQFESQCGVTISAGVGQSIEVALANLRRAKLSGKNKVVGFSNIS